MAKQEEPELFNAQILYREWGRRFTVLQQYLKGIHYYEQSTNFGDENFIWTLLGLAEALKKSGQFKKAAEVAQKCMIIDPQSLKANYTRMEALFDIAEFCDSLVYAHRGAKRRIQFRHAVLLANETVEDCVGGNVPPNTLIELQPWIHKLGLYREKLKERLLEEEDEFEGIDEEQTRFKVSSSAARLKMHLLRLDRLLGSTYLGASAEDKKYLDELVRHPALPSANKAGSERLSATARECLRRQQSQQESLRTRRPLYSLRARAEAALTPGHRLANHQQLLLRRCLVTNLAKYMLRKLHDARLSRDYPLFFKLVERAKEHFGSFSLRLFPERERYLGALYRMVARAYLDPRNMCRLRGESEERRMAWLKRSLGLKGSWLPREEELAWPPSLDLRAAFRTCRHRLELATQPLEILWLFHELCKHFLQIKRYDMARFFSKKTRDLSEELGNEEWGLNAMHVLVRIELAQNNRNEAKEAAAVCLELATNLGSGFLVDYYLQVIQFVEKFDPNARFSDDDNIASRQRLVSSLMPPDLRPEFNLLMRAMEAVKPSRRLSIMPGCKSQDRGNRGGLPSNRRTVLPQPPPDYERLLEQALLQKFAPSDKVLGWLDFDDYDVV